MLPFLGPWCTLQLFDVAEEGVSLITGRLVALVTLMIRGGLMLSLPHEHRSKTEVYRTSIGVPRPL